MVRSIEGVFRDGKVELLESPPSTAESRVIVTFLAPGQPVDLKSRGIHPEQAADLNARLKTFAQDWQRPEMDAYDEL